MIMTMLMTMMMIMMMGVWVWVCVCVTMCVRTRLFNSRSHSGELRTQKLKSHLVRTQSLNVLPLKPGVGQYIAMHATLTSRDFFFAYFYPSGPFTCIFSSTSLDFSCVGCGPQNKKIIMPEADSRVECPRNIITKKNMSCGMMTCETNNLEIEKSLRSALM